MARPDLFVVARFLAKLADGELTRSKLQVATRVNYDILRRYAKLLEDRGWIAWREVAGLEVATLTREGRVVHEELQDWLLKVMDESVL